MRCGRGFTLLEVLVALAIFAVVAASVLSASASRDFLANIDSGLIYYLEY